MGEDLFEDVWGIYAVKVNSLMVGVLSSKAKYGVLSDSEEYREGKLKRI